MADCARFRFVAGAAASPSLLLQPLAGAEQQRSVELEQTVARLVVRGPGRAAGFV